MTTNESQLHTGIERQENSHSMLMSLGMNFQDLVLFGFLEQSARYLGVYYNHDHYQAMEDESNIIN